MCVSKIDIFRWHIEKGDLKSTLFPRALKKKGGGGGGGGGVYTAEPTHHLHVMSSFSWFNDFISS